jgi:hypothetical protein
VKKIISTAIFFIVILNLYPKEIKLKIIDKELDMPLEGVKIKTLKNEIFTSDSNGDVSITVDDSIIQVNLLVFMPGYEQKKIVVSQFDKEITVNLVLSGMIEGEELVVEGKKSGKTDDKSGISNVLDKSDLKSTAMMGLVEDVMSSIKTLPGVGFTNGWGSLPSIRGGDPNELTSVYDGFLVRYPFHWGNAYSIFNPNVVESAKLSNGVYSAKNGMALSGLLEVESKNPKDNIFKFNFVSSTTTSEIFMQIPMSKISGLLIGARATYYSLIMVIPFVKSYIASQGMEFTIPPYLIDGYLKWFLKPDDRFEWYVNGFFGSDGIGIKTSNQYQVDENKKTSAVRNDIVSYANFAWYNYNAIGMTGFKIFPNDRFFIHIMAGYNFHSSGPDGKYYQKGTKDYSQEFIAKYGALLSGKTSFTIPEENGTYWNTSILHSIQSRIDTDFSINDRILMSFGGGVISDYTSNNGGASMYQVVWNGSSVVYKKVTYALDFQEKEQFNSFLYLNFNFNPFPNKLTIDLGMRLDHVFIAGKDMTLNTYPVPNPRFYIAYTPVRDLRYLEHFTLSFGTGLFSKAPEESYIADKKYGVKDFEIGPTRTLTNVLGFEFGFPFDVKLKVEGYYKFYFNRNYMNTVLQSDNSYAYRINSDGIGHVGGFDIYFQRKLSRYLDGSFSYSFVYTRFLNPTTDGVPGETDSFGDPTGKDAWYYPSYYRMHNLNLVLNVHPLSWMTIMTEFSFATGTPMKEKESTTMFPATNADNGDIMELYAANYVYNDNLWNGFSIPLNLKISFNYFFPKTRLQLEAYIAVENLFAMIYTPAGATRVDIYSGKEILGTEANVSIPIPIPSLGIKLNF